MKQVYSDLKFKTGEHVAGICEVLFTLREWLAADPVIDFETGCILDPLILKNNTFWMKLDVLKDTYVYDETPKSNKSGSYYEIACSGMLNEFHYGIQQVLQTLRNSEMVVLLTDMNDRRKLVGNTSAGMTFTYGHHVKNAAPSFEQVPVDLFMQSENPAPFYNIIGTPEIIDNILLISTGNFLFIS